MDPRSELAAQIRESAIPLTARVLKRFASLVMLASEQCKDPNTFALVWTMTRLAGQLSGLEIMERLLMPASLVCIGGKHQYGARTILHWLPLPGDSEKMLVSFMSFISILILINSVATHSCVPRRYMWSSISCRFKIVRSWFDRHPYIFTIHHKAGNANFPVVVTIAHSSRTREYKRCVADIADITSCSVRPAIFCRNAFVRNLCMRDVRPLNHFRY